MFILCLCLVISAGETRVSMCVDILLYLIPKCVHAIGRNRVTRRTVNRTICLIIMALLLSLVFMSVIIALISKQFCDYCHH